MRAFLMFFLVVCAVSLFTSTAEAQLTQNDVIINEFVVNPTSPGSMKEYVELLVVKSGGVDLRGYRLSDVGTKGGAGGATEGHLDFPNQSYLSNLPRGTRIICVLETPTVNTNSFVQDTDPSDSLLILFSSNLAGGVLAATNVMDLSTNENIELLSDGTAGAVTINFVGCGSNSSSGNFSDATWVGNLPVSTSNDVQYFRNSSCGGLNNDSGAVGWIANAALADTTPGRKNVGQTFPWQALTSGNGTATLVNNAGTFLGSTIFGRNAGSQTVLVTITGECTANLDTVKLTVPAGWTGYNPAMVTLGGAFTGKSNTGSGSTIVIAGAALGATAGTIQISSLTSPNPVGAQLSGSDQWVIQTAVTGTPAANIGSSPKTQTIIPIQNLRTGGTDGFGNSDAGITPALNGTIVAVAGVITSPNNILTDSITTSIIIQNAGYGIQVFKSASNTLHTLLLGDSIIVRGTVTGFNGNMEVNPNGVTSPDLYDIGASTVPAPTVIAGAGPVGEAVEGKLIKINSVSWVSSGQTFSDSIQAGRNNFYNGTDSGTVLITKTNALDGNPIPSTSVLIGTVYHRTDITTGSKSAYKVVPRGPTDVGGNPADGTGLASISPPSRLTGASGVSEAITFTGESFTIWGFSISIPPSWTWDGTSKALSGTGFSGAASAVTGTGAVGDPYVITVTNAAVTSSNTGTVTISNLTAPGNDTLTTFDCKSRGNTGGVLTDMAASPTVSIVSNLFAAVQTGNWSQTTTWAGGAVPTASDSVSFTTPSVVVTVDISNAICKALSMEHTASGSGPMLQFQATGTPQLTINGSLSIRGGANRPKLTSNGNSSATLIVKGPVYTNSSNAVGNGSAGLNMNEGTVKLTGATTDTLKNGAGFRMGNLEIGDGSQAKTLVWAPSTAATMDVKSLRVKAGSTFLIGSGSNLQANNIGSSSSDTSIVRLTGGIHIELGATLAVQNFPDSIDVAQITIAGGGIDNNGTLDLTVAAEADGIAGSQQILHNCHYNVSFGFASGPSANQTISGSGSSQYAGITVAGNNTLTLNTDMPIPSLYSMTLLGTLVESAGNTVIGSVITTRAVSQSTDETFGGIGLKINAAGAAPGSTTVTRVTGSSLSGNGGHQSILRNFTIVPTTNAGLNATLEFTYDTSEVNGQIPGTFQLFKSTNAGVTWTSPSSTNNVSGHKLTATGQNDLSVWTVADAGHSLSAGTFVFHTTPSWNLMSIPVTVGDYRKTVLFPSALSKAFAYVGTSYKVKDTLANAIGFWVKFAGVEADSVLGVDRLNDTMPVVDGWNMIGSVIKKTPKSTVIQSPTSIVKSNYFSYNGAAYVIEDTIRPGKGLWVKAGGTGGNGKLIVNSPPSAIRKEAASPMEAIKQLNSLTITDKSGNRQTLYFGENYDGAVQTSFCEMPPVAPEVVFDVRFGSGRFAETYTRSDERQSFPIIMHASSYPLTFSWKVGAGERSIMLTSPGGLKQSLSGEGKWTLSAAVPSLDLTVSSGSLLPSVYSLSENYPNPFNPSTKFQIGVPRTSVVDVVVFDLLGRKVRTLLHEERSAGFHTVEWNGLNDDNAQVTSGVYFVRMASDKFSATRKIMMMK